MEETNNKSDRLRNSLFTRGRVIAVLAGLLIFFQISITQAQTAEGPQLSTNDYQFKLVTQSGKTIKLKKFKGDVIFINLWASWCAPCIAEMPTIETLYNKVSEHENIHFVMLSMDQNRAKANEYMNSKDFSFIHYFPASTIPRIFRTVYLPTTYVVSQTGEVVFRHQGLGDYSTPAFRKWLVNLAKK